MKSHIGGFQVMSRHPCQGLKYRRPLFHLLTQWGGLCRGCADVSSQVSSAYDDIEALALEEGLVLEDIPLWDNQDYLDWLHEVASGGSVHHKVIQVSLDVWEGPTTPRIISVPWLGNLWMRCLEFPY